MTDDRQLQTLLDKVGWHDAPEGGRGYYWAVFRWMEQATRQIEALQTELERERNERREACSTLDAMIWQATS